MIAPFTLAENNSNVIFYGIWRAIGVEQKAVLCRVNFTNGLLFLDLILVYELVSKRYYWHELGLF